MDEVETALRAGVVTMTGRVVTDPYAPVGRRDRLWLHNKLVRSGAVLVSRTLSLRGHQWAVRLFRWFRRPQYCDPAAMPLSE